MYTIRTKSGMLFASTEQNEMHGKEVEYDTKAEADKHIEILKKSFPNEEFYVHKKNEVGRPAIGVTKKVSLTLSENDWEWLDEKAEGNRSQFLRETITNYLGAEKMSEIEVQYIVNGKDQVLLNNLKEQAIKLKNAISNNSTNINNHDLVTSTISNLEFFIENLSDVYE